MTTSSSQSDLISPEPIAITAIAYRTMADEHTAEQDFATKGNSQEIINTITVPVNNGNITIVSGNNNIINLSER